MTSVTDLPQIMTAKGWTRGATLMRRWFAANAAVSPSYGPSDSTTIDINWVLACARAKVVYEMMVKDEIWSRPVSRQLLGARLQELKMINMSFDFSKSSPEFQQSNHINFRTIKSGYLSKLDDYVASLGNFSIYVVPISGSIQAIGSQKTIILRDVGFLVMDSYDFEGNQDLGCWDKNTNNVSQLYFRGGTKISNLDFRQWRLKNKKGGDFKLYSNTKAHNLKRPLKFTL